MGEKTGWTYVDIPSKAAELLLPGNKRSFRVKGSIDDHEITQMALIPIGEGNFILPVNANLRKVLRKQKGDTIILKIEIDLQKPGIPKAILDCFDDEPKAYEEFMKLPGSHRNYYIKWIMSAKTMGTRAKRIACTIDGLLHHLTFAETMKSASKK